MLYRRRFLKLSLIVGSMGLGGYLSFAAQTPEASKTKDINALMVERRDVLSKIVTVHNARISSGVGSPDALYEAQEELLSAELELAKTREDRLAALHSKLSHCQSLEKRALAIENGGQSRDINLVLKATAERLQAEIQILRELAADK